MLIVHDEENARGIRRFWRLARLILRKVRVAEAILWVPLLAYIMSFKCTSFATIPAGPISYEQRIKVCLKFKYRQLFFARRPPRRGPYERSLSLAGSGLWHRAPGVT